jgi:hypothetical protein
MNIERGEHSWRNPDDLPEWLSQVPISREIPVWVPVGEAADGSQKQIPHSLLVDSLRLKVGTSVVSLRIDPALRSIFAQFTENQGWRNLPSEITLVERIADDRWNVQVGEYKREVTRAEIEGRLRKALLPEIEGK